jgi:hypothetical protein
MGEFVQHQQGIEERIQFEQQRFDDKLEEESVSVTFDRVIKSVNGSISGIKMTTYDPSVTYIEKAV